MVAKIESPRQTPAALVKSLFLFNRLSLLIVKGAQKNDSARAFALMGILLSLVGCSSAPRVGGEAVLDPGAPVSESCEAIRAFLGNEAIRLTDLRVLKDQMERLFTESEKDQAPCPEKRRLEKLRKQVDSRLPSNPQWAVDHAATLKLENALIEKNDGFKWRLPGEKGPASRATYFKRLSFVPERNKRQSLYKLFNSSRSRKWVTWGFKDLIRARKQEALAAGYTHYLEFALTRNGQHYGKVLKSVELVREGLSDQVRNWMKRHSELAGLSSLEPWDFYFVIEKAWGPSWMAPLRTAPAKAPIEYAKSFLHGVGLDLMSVAGTSDAAGLTFRLDSPVVRSDFGAVVGNLAVETYLNEVKQSIPLFQRPSESSREAIHQTFQWLALQSPSLPLFVSTVVAPSLGTEVQAAPLGLSPLALEAYRHASRFTFESRWYEDPEVDPFELWTSVNREFFGIEITPFYGGFDEESFLKNPGVSGEKVLGNLVAAGLVDSILQNGGPSADLGQRFKKEWFSVGSEAATLELLNRFSAKDWSLNMLQEKLSNALKE